MPLPSMVDAAGKGFDWVCACGSTAIAAVKPGVEGERVAGIQVTRGEAPQVLCLACLSRSLGFNASRRPVAEMIRGEVAKLDDCRQIALRALRRFLMEPAVPDDVKAEEVRSTVNAIMQMAAVLGSGL